MKKLIFLGLLLNSFLVFAHPFTRVNDYSYSCSETSCGFDQKIEFGLLNFELPLAQINKTLDAITLTNKTIKGHLNIPAQLIIDLENDEGVAHASRNNNSITLNPVFKTLSKQDINNIFIHEYGHVILNMNFLYPFYKKMDAEDLTSEQFDALDHFLNSRYGKLTEMFADMFAAGILKNGDIFKTVNSVYPWDKMPSNAKDAFSCRNYERPINESIWDSNDPIFNDDHVYFCPTSGVYWRTVLKKATSPGKEIKKLLNQIYAYSENSVYNSEITQNSIQDNLNLQKIIFGN